jgi:hypothetical protein
MAMPSFPVGDFLVGWIVGGHEIQLISVLTFATVLEGSHLL